MKKFIIICILFSCIMLLIWKLANERMKKLSQKSYSVTIIHGSPMISYEATIQVDSIKYISKESAIVYFNGASLQIKADFITFKKN